MIYILQRIGLESYETVGAYTNRVLLKEDADKMVELQHCTKTDLRAMAFIQNSENLIEIIEYDDI